MVYSLQIISYHPWLLEKDIQQGLFQQWVQHLSAGIQGATEGFLQQLWATHRPQLFHKRGHIQNPKPSFENTVDGQNPAPPRMMIIPLYTRFHTSQVVQDFFHQQYYGTCIEHLRFLIHAMCFSKKMGGGLVQTSPQWHRALSPCQYAVSLALWKGRLLAFCWPPDQKFPSNIPDTPCRSSDQIFIDVFTVRFWFPWIFCWFWKSQLSTSTLVSTAVSLLLQVTCALVPPKPKEERPDTRTLVPA